MSNADADRYLVARVRERLTQDPRVNDPELEVAIAAGKVVVSGSIPTEERRAAVLRVVTELLPDHEVVNQTTVAPQMKEPNVEEIR
jgi:osmotically-inducible protein OsmY